MTELLRTEGLAKGFTLHLQAMHSQEPARIQVLHGVDLLVSAGECVALAGPSGAGKSTLMRALYGNYRADAGRVLVRHRGAWADIARADPRLVLDVRRHTLGYVSQFLRVVPRVPSVDVAAEPAAARGVPVEEARRRAADLLSRLGIPPLLHRLPPATFSGGEQQRVNLARGFVAGHDVLLLDEPTASLDRERRDVVVAMIQEAKARGAAVVGIFHDEAVRDAVADRMFPVHPSASAQAA